MKFFVFVPVCVTLNFNLSRVIAEDYTFGILFRVKYCKEY